MYLRKIELKSWNAILHLSYRPKFKKSDHTKCWRGYAAAGALIPWWGRSMLVKLHCGSVAMQETRVRSLGREDPLEKGMAIHSSNLAWRIPWTEMLHGLQFVGSQRVRHNWATNTHIHTHTHTHTHCGKHLATFNIIENTHSSRYTC